MTLILLDTDKLSKLHSCTTVQIFKTRTTTTDKLDRDTSHDIRRHITTINVDTSQQNISLIVF